MTMRHFFRLLTGVILLLAATAPQKAAAQAFDGDMDAKIHAGYLNVGGHSGAELAYYTGISDYFSYGCFAKMVFDGDEDETDNLGWADVGGAFYFHWDELLKLPDCLDLHTGFQLSWQSGGVAAGLRYNFSERWGLYAQVQQGLFDVLRPKEFDYSFSGRKFGVSVGLTFSL